MLQIEKKVCHEDSESLLVPHIASSILQSIAESSNVAAQERTASNLGLISSDLSAGGSMQRNLHLQIVERAKVINSSKNLFVEPPRSADKQPLQ
jgi:hypothetical protein